MNGRIWKEDEVVRFILFNYQMEKLIELLNEYIGDWQEWLYACYPLDEDFDKFFHTKDWEGTLEEAQVISKKFWFIQWLVDNDKIDFNNVRETNYWWEFNYYWTIPNSKRNKEIQIERLLMILAIQDNPIEFLISILK